MQYRFETTYNQKTLTTMARCIRKTVRRPRNQKSHILGWIVIAMALPLVFLSDGSTAQRVVISTALLVMLAVLLFEDQINGLFARKRLLKGTETAKSVFDTENTDTFVSQTVVGKSEFSYQRIAVIAETDEYFVFIFSENHAQSYLKSSLSGGTPDEFRQFISEKTNKPILSVK